MIFVGCLLVLSPSPVYTAAAGLFGLGFAVEDCLDGKRGGFFLEKKDEVLIAPGVPSFHTVTITDSPSYPFYHRHRLGCR